MGPGDLEHASAPEGISWFPPQPPETVSFSFDSPPVETCISQEAADLRGTAPSVESWEVTPPKVVAIPVVIGSIRKRWILPFHAAYAERSMT